MLHKLNFLKKKELKETDNTLRSDYLIAQSAKELLSIEHRAQTIRKIKRSFSVTEDIWVHHYLYAIEQFAEIVQGLPASENHHHSEVGGLLDHTLEALYAGVRIAQGFVLPPNTEPEKIAAGSDRWRFGAFIAILAHDLGKVITDIEVVYRYKKGEFKLWMPWYGNIDIGSEYTYRYRDKTKNSKSSKSLHEKTAMSLLPRLLTKEAAKWLFEDIELLSQLFSTISHSTFGGQAIKEIVRTADRNSVGSNLGAETGVNTDHSQTVPLHEKLIVSLRKLIAEGELKCNKPGAALWVTEECTWAVSKAVMGAVQSQLLNEGHKGIPKNVVRMFEVLKDHQLIEENKTGDSVWTAEVHDNVKNWTQKLTFLKFSNDVLWVTKEPTYFDGTVIADEKNAPTEQITENVAEGNNKLQTELFTNEEKSHKNEVIPTIGKNEKVSKKTLKEVPVKAGRIRKESELQQDDFINWLLRGIKNQKLRVNEPKAAVHIIDNHLALVTPSIFLKYLKANPIKKKIYEKTAENGKVYSELQKELEKLNIHHVGTNGSNINKVLIEGPRKQAEMYVYLLDRGNFPSLAAFNSNAAIKVK